MTTIDLSQPLALTAGPHVFVARSGNNIRLRHAVSGSILDTTLAELGRAGVGERDAPETSARALEVVASTAAAKASQLAEHVCEIETGARSDGRGGEIRRPEYDINATTQEQRIVRKMEDLRVHHAVTMSRATLMRHLKRFRESGPAGLVDKRATRTRGPLDRLDDKVYQALTEVMVKQKNATTGTRSRVIMQVEALLMRTPVAGRPEMPSKASMYRYIDALDGGRHTTGSATTRRSRAARPNRTFADTSRLLPGSEVQVDTHTLDLLIQTPEGPARPYLTIMLDVASRSVLSWTLRLEATKGVDHAFLLAGALFPPELRPDRSTWREVVRAHRPDLRLRSGAEVDQARCLRPYVFPRLITMDNGKDYVGNTFLSAVAKWRIDAHFSAPHTPVDKAKVERMFRTIETLLIQHLPGYVGGGSGDRGYEVEKDPKLLDFRSLYEVLEDWFLFEWQNRPHEGLRDRLDPSILYTPNQVLARASELTSTLRIPMSLNDLIDLMPTEFRRIGDTGVQLNNRHYDDDELHPLRHSKSSYPNKNGRWKVKYDPYNPSFVWVEGRDGQWIVCQARDSHLYTQPYVGQLAPSPESERSAVARIGSEQVGIAIPLPAIRPPAHHPEDFEDDFEDLEPLDTFDPDEED